MVRTIITPAETSIQLSIPKDYVGKKIEITCLALDELIPATPPQTMADFFGTLPEETYNELKKETQNARKEWNRDF